MSLFDFASKPTGNFAQQFLTESNPAIKEMAGNGVFNMENQNFLMQNQQQQQQFNPTQFNNSTPAMSPAMFQGFNPMESVGNFLPNQPEMIANGSKTALPEFKLELPELENIIDNPTIPKIKNQADDIAEKGFFGDMTGAQILGAGINTIGTFGNLYAGLQQVKNGKEAVAIKRDALNFDKSRYADTQNAYNNANNQMRTA